MITARAYHTDDLLAALAAEPQLPTNPLQYDMYRRRAVQLIDASTCDSIGTTIDDGPFNTSVVRSLSGYRILPEDQWVLKVDTNQLGAEHHIANVEGYGYHTIPV